VRVFANQNSGTVGPPLAECHFQNLEQTPCIRIYSETRNKELMKNRTLIPLFAANLLMALTMTAHAQTDPLTRYRWNNRVLVVVAPGRQNDKAQAQRRAFEQATAGMAERDVVLLDATGDDDRSRTIRKHLSVGNDAFKVLLVGKDGNTAVSSEQPLSADDLFRRIDAMPMRRGEMRAKR
jgi:Domain of unknown function (DUF4174)